MSTVVALWITRTNNRYQLVDKHRYLDREDAHDLHGPVECQDRLLNGPVVCLGNVPQTQLQEGG